MYDEMEMNNATETATELAEVTETTSGFGTGLVAGAIGAAAVYGIIKGIKWLVSKRKAKNEADDEEVHEVKDVEIEVVEK